MNDDPEEEIKQEETGAAEPELLYSDAPPGSRTTCPTCIGVTLANPPRSGATAGLTALKP